jgi:hypothetical protein
MEGMTTKRPSLSARKARLRHKIVYGPQADDMPVATFSRLLQALDVTRTHEQLDALSKAWRETLAK